jgi:hypothetical protein
MLDWMTLKTLARLCMIGLALVMPSCAAVVDSEGAKVGDPVRFAQATQVARVNEAVLQATATAVSLQTTRTAADISAQATRTVADITARATTEAIAQQAQQADADKAKAGAAVVVAQAETELNAQGAALAGKSTLYLLGYAGLGIGALVLVIGLALGVSAWVNKRATSVYPNKAGQFPVIVTRGPGYVALHDPNRGLGPGSVIRTPGLIERAAYGLALAQGKAPMLEPGAEYPQTASEPIMAQIGTGAQAVQNEVAKQSGRPKLLFGFLPVGAQPAQGQTRTRSRMPQISVINDPKEIEHFEQKLLGDGGNE